MYINSFIFWLQLPQEFQRETAMDISSSSTTTRRSIIVNNMSLMMLIQILFIIVTHVSASSSSNLGNFNYSNHHHSRNLLANGLAMTPPMGYVYIYVYQYVFIYFLFRFLLIDPYVASILNPKLRIFWDWICVVYVLRMIII